jgi:hypothetical protein
MDKRVETPYARAWREFQDSPEGLRVLAGANLGIPLSQHKYFVNRLQAAFDAGWNARPAVSASTEQT